jgi:hypothetical protein
MPGPAPSKTNVGVIIAIVVGAVVVIGAIIAAIVLLAGGGRTLTCTGEQSTMGVSIAEEYTFRFRGGLLNSTDWTQVTRSTSTSLSIGDLYDIVRPEFEGHPNTTINLQGDSIVVDMRDLEQSQLRNTGLIMMGSGSIDRNSLKETIEGLRGWNFTCN